MDFQNDMRGQVNKGLLKYAVGQAMFCPRCRRAMDVKRAVLITMTFADKRERTAVRCAKCYDNCSAELTAVADSTGTSLDIIDGRTF